MKNDIKHAYIMMFTINSIIDLISAMYHYNMPSHHPMDGIIMLMDFLIIFYHGFIYFFTYSIINKTTKVKDTKSYFLCHCITPNVIIIIMTFFILSTLRTFRDILELLATYLILYATVMFYFLVFKKIGENKITKA